MKLVILGAGSTIHHPKRTSTSSLVATDIGNFLVDCGPGSSHRLTQAGFSASDIRAILITHLHQDHCLELPTLFLSRILEGHLDLPDIYGPPGIIKHCSVLFSEMFPDIPQVMQKRGGEFSPRIHEIEEGEVLVEAEVHVASTKVIHTIPAVGYRISEKSHSVGFSGDTEPCENLIELCRDTDILVHECIWHDEEGPAHFHTIPSQLGLVAQKARTKHLVMNHFHPKIDGHEQEMVQSVAKNFSGRITIAEDLMEFEI